MPIWYEGLDERQAKMRKKIPDLAWDDQEDEFVEEITEESNANWETSKDKEEHSEISE